MIISHETCEVLTAGAWTLTAIEDAACLDASRQKRCPECHGRVHLHEHGTDAYLEHSAEHFGCSRSYEFQGTPSPHPKALF